jgi:hypothetical protein
MAGEVGPALGRPGRFFIVGCQRSGTTLLRLILECHPDVSCLDEQQAYRALVRDEPVPPGKLRLGFKIPRWTEMLAAPSFPDHELGTVVGPVYRGEPLLFMLREVRDTVASMLRLRASRQHSWLDYWGRRELAQKMREPEFRDRFHREIDTVRAGGDALHLVGALYWKYKTRAYLQYRDGGWPVCPVRYESLVASPEEHLRRALACLGLRWNAALLSHPHFPHAEVGADGTTTGKTDPRRPIDTRSVGQWRQVLSGEQEAGILAIAGALNEWVAEAPLRPASPGPAAD